MSLPPTSTAPKTSTDISPSPNLSDYGAWIEPTAALDVDELLIAIRETQHLLRSLEQRRSDYLVQLDTAREQGLLDAYTDPENECRIQIDGCTISRAQRKTKVWDDEIKQRIKQAEYEGKRLGLFTEKITEYWTCKVK